MQFYRVNMHLLFLKLRHIFLNEENTVSRAVSLVLIKVMESVAVGREA